MAVGYPLYHSEPVDWIDKETFKRLLRDYMKKKKSSKTIISFDMAMDIIKILSKEKRQSQIGTASFRYWARKRFVIQHLNQETYLCPKTMEGSHIKIGKPVCVAEEMMSVLIQAHDTGTSHRSFSATYRKLQTIRSYVPREICFQFVQYCTECHPDIDLSFYHTL